MKLISHRGNIDGRIEDYENEPKYIDLAISKGYDVEVDVWVIEGFLYLGHDNPKYQIYTEWFYERNSKLWIHCKNIESLGYFRSLSYPLNYFWHQEDDVTITSLGYLWTYPGKKLTKYSIAVMPEFKQFDDILISYGICSDHIEKYQKK